MKAFTIEEDVVGENNYDDGMFGGHHDVRSRMIQLKIKPITQHTSKSQQSKPSTSKPPFSHSQRTSPKTKLSESEQIGNFEVYVLAADYVKLTKDRDEMLKLADPENPPNTEPKSIVIFSQNEKGFMKITGHLWYTNTGILQYSLTT